MRSELKTFRNKSFLNYSFLLAICVPCMAGSELFKSKILATDSFNIKLRIRELKTKQTEVKINIKNYFKIYSMPRLKIKRVSIHNMNSTAVLNQFSSDNIHHNKALRQTNSQEIIVEKSFKKPTVEIYCYKLY